MMIASSPVSSGFFAKDSGTVGNPGTASTAMSVWAST
jgi:hypothetical protein